MQIVGVYPISGNPVTWGHADIAFRAAHKCKKLYWALAVNSQKNYSFSVQERLKMLKLYVEHYKLTNVEVDAFEISTVRYAEKKGANVLVRGLRNSSDYQMELDLATCNRGINKDIETICFFSKPHYATIKSSLVMELASIGESIDQYVLPDVAKIIYKKIKTAKKKNKS